MGLQNQLTDMSSESVPILMVALIANCVCYLRSLLFICFETLGFSFARFDETNSYQIDGALYEAVGSGLAGVIMLAEQLNLNRVFSYELDGKSGGGYDDGSGLNCVFCLDRISEGDQVRKLACRHVFHKHCFAGWLDRLNFNCPICRSSLVEEERVGVLQRRVTWDVFAWFSSI